MTVEFQTLPQRLKKFALNDIETVKEVLKVTPIPAVIVDVNRRVVELNDGVIEITGGQLHKGDLLGHFPGEIFGCEHALSETGTCGQTCHCKYCGFNQVLMHGLEGIASRGRCLLTLKANLKACMIQVWGCPISFEDNQYCLIFVQDASVGFKNDFCEKYIRDEAFNSLISIQELSDYLGEEENPIVQEWSEVLKLQTSRMESKIKSKLMWMDLEDGDIFSKISLCHPSEVIKNTINEVTQLFPEVRIQLKSSVDDDQQALQTDPNLLQMVMMELFENAIEAAESDEQILCGYHFVKGYCAFWIQNDAVLDDHTQEFIFKCGFTTRERGHGMGTYFVRVITENYLKGRASFVSEDGLGTCFTLEIPLVYPEQLSFSGHVVNE